MANILTLSQAFIRGSMSVLFLFLSRIVSRKAKGDVLQLYTGFISWRRIAEYGKKKVIQCYMKILKGEGGKS